MDHSFMKRRVLTVGKGKATTLLGLMGREQLGGLAQEFGLASRGSREELAAAIVAAAYPAKPCGCAERAAARQLALVEAAQDEDPGQGGPVPGTGDR